MRHASSKANSTSGGTGGSGGSGGGSSGARGGSGASASGGIASNHSGDSARTLGAVATSRCRGSRPSTLHSAVDVLTGFAPRPISLMHMNCEGVGSPIGLKASSFNTPAHGSLRTFRHVTLALTLILTLTLLLPTSRHPRYNPHARTFDVRTSVSTQSCPCLMTPHFAASPHLKFNSTRMLSAAAPTRRCVHIA